MKEFHLLIDDLREPEGMDDIARTSTDACLALMQHEGVLTHLYLDHDLGEPEATGYTILNWAIKRNLLPPNVYLVTANPVGRDNMARALESEGYTFTRGWYRKEA
jgi:hypothetical protein